MPVIMLLPPPPHGPGAECMPHDVIHMVMAIILFMHTLGGGYAEPTCGVYRSKERNGRTFLPPKVQKDRIIIIIFIGGHYYMIIIILEVTRTCILD